MKKHLLTILFFSCTFSLFSQNTFNKRFTLNFRAVVFTAIYPTDSCYYLSGIFSDTLLYNLAGTLFAKFDLEGNPVFVKTLKSMDRTYEVWFNTLRPTPDYSGFYATGYSFTFPGMEGFMVRYNNEGDTLWTKTYSNPYAPNVTFFFPKDLQVESSSGNLYFLSTIGDNQYNLHFYLIKTDSSGNKLFDRDYGTYVDFKPQSMLLTSEGKLILGGFQYDALNYDTASYRTYLFTVDTLMGDVESFWISPPPPVRKDAANDMLMLPDGKLIIASGSVALPYGSEYPYITPSVFCLSPQGEVLWETFFDELYGYNSKARTLIQCPDGSGYVVVGYFDKYGWIGKVSPQGDSLWMRTYTFPTDSPQPELFHIFYDVHAVPDGGFILCGESHESYTYNTTGQYGWLLKLDEYGCLVPGCQFMDDVSTAIRQTEESSTRIKIYPNPTSDFLNLWYFLPQKPTEAQLLIYNSSGQKVCQQKLPDFQTHTFILAVYDWPAGTYFLQISERGKNLSSSSFRIQ